MEKSVHPVYEDPLRELLRPKNPGEILYTSCTKFYPDGAGGWYPVKRVVFDRPIYNPSKAEYIRDRFDVEDVQSIQDPVDVSDPGRFWLKSFNRARQACFDYLMCNPDLDTFLTFTVDPDAFDRNCYAEIVRFLSRWLDNRVRRKGLKYILVPELHKKGGFHFHGVANHEALALADSGYRKLVGKKYEKYKPIHLSRLFVPAGEEKNVQIIYNVTDLPMGFSTAIRIDGESAQQKISKYIWKYMTKQQGTKIAGRFYLHGGALVEPKLVYTDESIEESDGVLVSYGGTACKIETLNRI